MEVIINDIKQLLNENKIANNGIGHLVLEYAVLKQKLDNIEDQTWFFMKGIDSNKKRLQKLKNAYITTQNYFNENALDVLIVLKNEKEEKLNEVDWKNVSMITRMWKGWLINDISELNEYIAVKKYFKQLPEIECLLNDLDQFLLLLNTTDQSLSKDEN